jgi:YD repeat-containing protein
MIGLATDDHAAPITKFIYDREDNLVKLTDAAGEDTDFEYDAMGRLKLQRLPAPGGDSETSLLQPETVFVYDAAGNLKEEKVFTAESTYRVTTHDYDARNLLIKTTFADPNYATSLPEVLLLEGEHLQPIVSYVYDSVGNLKHEIGARFGDDETRPSARSTNTTACTA